MTRAHIWNKFYYLTSIALPNYRMKFIVVKNRTAALIYL